jgi:hypothetical protein
MRIVLVRHSTSAVDPSTSPHAWGLTDSGAALAAALDLGGLRLLAGPEPKMVQTLEPHGPVEVDARFAESRSEGWLGADEFARTIERYFARPDDPPAPGWEPASAVVERFTLVDGAAICSGGRAISAVVARLTGCDGLELWRTLRMPHVIVLSGDERDRWVASTSHE